MDDMTLSATAEIIPKPNLLIQELRAMLDDPTRNVKLLDAELVLAIMRRHIVYVKATKTISGHLLEHAAFPEQVIVDTQREVEEWFTKKLVRAAQPRMSQDFTEGTS